MVTAVLALGTNLGDRIGYLRGALEMLENTVSTRVSAVSPVYETAPVGGPEQPDYLNAVVVVETDLPALTLLARAQAIEHALGRTREVRWGPRTVDVDVITYGDTVDDDPDLTLPHPRAHERAFVLAPLADVAPDAVLPGHGSVRDLLAAVGTAGVHRRDDLSVRETA